MANYRPILLKNAVTKIVDGFLFGDMLVGTLKRHLTSNSFPYRPMIGADDAVWEGIIHENQTIMKIAVISWNIKGTFDDLPYAVVLNSISSTGSSVQARNVVKSYLEAQASYVQVGKEGLELIKKHQLRNWPRLAYCRTSLHHCKYWTYIKGTNSNLCQIK